MQARSCAISTRQLLQTIQFVADCPAEFLTLNHATIADDLQIPENNR